MRYICKRVVGVIQALAVVTTFVFFLVCLILGDPARQVAGPQAIREGVELVGEQLGLNEPLPQQYASCVTGLVRGDLGTSLRTKHPMLTEIQGHCMNTVQLILLSLVRSVITGVLIDVWSGRNRSKWQGYTGTTVTVSGISMPSFWTRLMLITVLAIKHRLLSTTGVGSFKNPTLLPIALGISTAAIIARSTRSSVVEVPKEDYMCTARAKGLWEKTVTWKYVFHNCMISVVTVVGLQFGFLLGGSVVMETVFTLPGFGSLPTESVNYRDYPIIQSLILIFSLYFVPVNLAVDVLHAVLDLEIRLS